MIRPNISVKRVWATHSIYPAIPVKDWSSTPVKIAYSDDEIANGHVPGVQPKPMQFNWWQNQQSAWIAAADGYDVRNWHVLASGIGYDLACGAFDVLRNLLYLGGAQAGGARMLVSPSGGVDNTLSGSIDLHANFNRFLDMAICPDGGSPFNGDLVMVGETSAVGTGDYSGAIGTFDVSTSTADVQVLPGAGLGVNRAHAVKWAPSDSVWLIVGRRDDGVGGVNRIGVWAIDNVGSTPIIVAIDPGLAYNTTAILLACGASLNIVSDHQDVWVSPTVNATDPWVHNPTGFTPFVDLRGLEYNTVTAMFMAVDQIDGTHVRISTSVDGAIWTVRNTLASVKVTAPPGLTGSNSVWDALTSCSGTLRCWGSSWVLSLTLTASGSRCLFWSVDDGTTWAFVPCPTIAPPALILGAGGLGVIGSLAGAEASRYAMMMR